MDSPYKPGFGARPAVLVGRDAHVARAQAVLARVENSGRPGPITVFTGARGLGKTVMLGVIAERARLRGFVPVSVSFDRVSDSVQILAAAVAEAVAALPHPPSSEVWQRLRQRLAALSVEVNAGVVKVVSKPVASPTTTTVQRQVLASLLEGAAQTVRDGGGKGLAVLLDEVQEAPLEHLVVLANALQDVTTGDRAPLVVFGAGLPQTPERLMEAASFAERFDFRTLDRLSREEGERALLEPALDVGVSWSPAAASVALDEASGSPYLIQYLGDEAWHLAAPRARGSIDEAAATAAVGAIRASLANGMFRGRWAEATDAERAVLIAMSRVRAVDGVVTTGDVSAALGVQARQWSMARRSLIDKGLIESVARGRMRFTMPGFASYVVQRHDADTVVGADGDVLPPAATPTALPAADLLAIEGG